MYSTQPTDLVRFCEQAFNRTERLNARDMWQKITDLVLPNSYTNFSTASLNTSRGHKTTQNLFEPTAIQANYDLAAAINSTMTSPTTTWSKMRHKDDNLNEDPIVTKFLSDANSTIHKYFADSNLYQQLHKGYQSLTALGNMALLHDMRRDKEGRFNGFQFTAIHLSQLAWSENQEGIVDTVYRKFPMTARQVMERWPDTVPEDLAKIAEKEPLRELSVMHCIKPRDPKQVRESAVGVPGKYKEFASIYVLMESNHILEEDGYDELPIYVIRWSTAPGEEYGRGPGHIAYPDVMSLNLLRYHHHQATALAINPPLLAIAGGLMSNQLDLRPGGITFLRRLDALQPMQSAARIDVAQLEEQSLKDSVNKIFMLDKLMLPPRTETGEMTAYEISQRVEQMQRVLGPTLTRLNNELLNPLVTRSFKMLYREGYLPEIPEALRQNDLDVDVLFVNQLARAQNTEVIMITQRFLQDVALMAQMDPSVLDIVNLDKTAQMAGRTYGVDEEILRSDDEIQQIRRAREEQQQAMMQAELNLKNADAQSKTGGA